MVRFEAGPAEGKAQIAMSAFFAFLHHVAAFALVAALVVEFVLIRDELNAATARRLARADMVLGISAGVLLVVGLLRVFYFEKGAAFYFHSVAFMAKLALFVLVALLSIYPSVKFISWSKAVRRGVAPNVDAGTLRAIRRLVHLELIGVVLILLFAALMARGIGYLR
jgi:putative membrane protein